MRRVTLLACSWLAALAWAAPVSADPCGMVPPVYVGPGTPLARVGLQKTYVFHKNGVETFVIRPGFSGKVEEFGMLIPFPEPPAVRKVADDLFAHIAAAIDPPEVVVDVRPIAFDFQAGNGAAAPAGQAGGLMLRDEVRVLRREAVGMYEVAVLEAGSAAALKRWMDDHGFKYPTGMDTVCEEYVEAKWCFVAVKTKVGGKAGVEPRPGQRAVDAGLPAGNSFDGHVQAMGFRFRSKNIVVPMRLSAFNEGELRNVVYLLTDSPRRIRSIPEEYVVRQVSGKQLYKNVTQPLPLRIIGGGSEADIPQWRRKSLPQERDPAPHNGLAKELFAADLLAARTGRLSHAHEEEEKVLLRIGEHFDLRGPEIDGLNTAVLKDQRAQVTAAALRDLEGMTLTVVDGDFPREVLAGQNLVFAEYTMPARRNTPRIYDCKSNGPGPDPRRLSRAGGPRALGLSRTFRWSLPLGLAFGLVGVVFWRRGRGPAN